VKEVYGRGLADPDFSNNQQGVMQVYLFHGHKRRRDKLVRELTGANLSVHTAPTGPALIELITETKPGLVFWDVDTDPHGWHLLDDRGCQMVLLASAKTERQDILERPCSRSVMMIALPYEAWRVRPIVDRYVALRSGARRGPAPTRRNGPALGRLPAVPARDAVVLSRAAQSPPPLPKEAAAEQDPSALRVLLADDDEVLCHILSYEFEEAGWVVTTSGDGVETQALLQTNRYDIVLLDLNLPHRNAFEILETLTGGGPPVVIISEQSQDEKVLRAYDLGARDFVCKPIRPRVLLTRITRAVSGVQDTMRDQIRPRLVG
jgi:CheY-like chemotaxis protein